MSGKLLSKPGDKVVGDEGDGGDANWDTTGFQDERGAEADEGG